MKQRVLYLIIILNVFWGTTELCAFAYARQYHSYWMQTGYSLLNYQTNSFSDGHLGFIGGYGYVWKSEQDVFFTLGAELSYSSSSVHQAPRIDFSTNEYVVDFKETLSVASAGVSALLSFSFDNATYLSVGVKGTYNFITYSKMSADFYESSLTSGKLIRAKGVHKKSVNFSPTLEYGYEIKLYQQHITNHLLRVGFFADYGLLNINKESAQNASVVVYNPTSNDVELYSALSVDQYPSTKLNNVFIGIKLNYFFCVKNICSCSRTQPGGGHYYDN